MIAQVLLNLLTDLVFESVTSRQRSYASEIDRYLDDRNVRPGFRTQKKPARPRRARTSPSAIGKSPIIAAPPLP